MSVEVTSPRAWVGVVAEVRLQPTPVRGSSLRGANGRPGANLGRADGHFGHAQRFAGRAPLLAEVVRSRQVPAVDGTPGGTLSFGGELLCAFDECAPRGGVTAKICPMAKLHPMLVSSGLIALVVEDAPGFPRNVWSNAVR